MTVAGKKKVAKPTPDPQLNQAQGSSGAAGGPESVDRIRQIIFGAQMEDYEQRFAQLESRLKKESAEIRKDLVRQFRTLEKALNREVERLSNQLKTERDTRAKATEKLAKDLQDEDRRLQALIESGGERFDGLLKSAEEEAKERLRDRFDRLQEAIEELKGVKTDRTALAKVLRQAADHLENSNKR